MNTTLTQSRLHSVLDYNPVTGIFAWKATGKGRKTVVGTPHRYWRDGESVLSGYWSIVVDQKAYLAHRLAWFYVHGVWPEAELDHDDRNGLHNAIGNLREATRAQNMKNVGLSKANTSGAKGVRRSRNGKGWQADVRVDGKTKYVGTYASVDEAATAAREAREQYHGDFARHE